MFTKAILWVGVLALSPLFLFSNPSLESVQRIESQAQHALRLLGLVRTATTMEDVLLHLDVLEQASQRLLDDCIGLSLGCAAYVDDPRVHEGGLYESAQSVETNARFAKMAIGDLRWALANEDHRMRSRALREMEGGLRFVRLGSAELRWQLQDLERSMP